MSDNRYNQCPPLMSDARHITSYVPNVTMNEFMKSQFNITDNNKFRTYLQQNATNIIQQERTFFDKNFSCVVDKKCSQK